MAEPAFLGVSAASHRPSRRRPLLYRWLRLVLPVTRPFSHASQAHRRHRLYVQLLLSCLLVLVSFALPRSLRGITTISYNLVLLALVFGLGAFSITPKVEHWMLQVYRLLGIATVCAQLFWSLTPLLHHGTGLPLLMLSTVFASWSTVRLVRLLAQERRINGQVLMGAVAGYLMIGICAGLLLGVLETIEPGSFRSLDASGVGPLLHGQLHGDRTLPVWRVDFERLTYFAFVTITTVGYGDIAPVSPQAQMMCVMFAVIGPLYIAVVMGVLISRLTIQSSAQTSASPSAPTAARSSSAAAASAGSPRPLKRRFRPRPRDPGSAGDS